MPSSSSVLKVPVAANQVRPLSACVTLATIRLTTGPVSPVDARPTRMRLPAVSGSCAHSTVRPLTSAPPILSARRSCCSTGGCRRFRRTPRGWELVGLPAPRRPRRPWARALPAEDREPKLDQMKDRSWPAPAPRSSPRRTRCRRDRVPAGRCRLVGVEAEPRGRDRGECRRRRPGHRLARRIRRLARSWRRELDPGPTGHRDGSDVLRADARRVEPGRVLERAGDGCLRDLGALLINRDGGRGLGGRRGRQHRSRRERRGCRHRVRRTYGRRAGQRRRGWWRGRGCGWGRCLPLWRGLLGGWLLGGGCRFLCGGRLWRGRRFFGRSGDRRGSGFRSRRGPN